MTDIVRTIREALEFHREHAGDPSVSWHDETVTQWLSQAADEIERQTKILHIAGRWAHAKQMTIAEANLGNEAWKTWDVFRGELEEELEERIAKYKETP